MKYFLISGEASGDLHGANLIRELKKIDNQADFCFFGGDNMSREAAVKPLRHIKDMAFMGVWDVIKNYKHFINKSLNLISSFFIPSPYFRRNIVKDFKTLIMSKFCYFKIKSRIIN